MTVPAMLRIILAAIFYALSGLPGAFAQAPPPVPALPDTPRITSYAISSGTGPYDVGWAVYGTGTDYGAWIEVWLDGVRLIPSSQWTLALTSGTLATAARPLTNARVTLTTAMTGTLQIIGAERPRRLSQFAENRGVAARDLNVAITDIIAQLREVWDKINDVTGRTVVAPPGETLTVLPKAATRANQIPCFGGGGDIQLCPPTLVPGVTAESLLGTTLPNVIQNHITRLYGGASVLSNAATVCDGTTDDTTGLQAVLSSGAQSVFIPPGFTCRTTGLTVPASVTFSWPGATLKKLGTGGAKVITVGGNNVTLIGGILDGNSDTTFAANGIFCQDHNTLTIDGVTFQNISYSHIFIVNCVTKFTLKNSNLLGGDNVDALGALFLAPTADSTDVVIHNNLCDRQGSINASGQACFNVVGDGSSIIRRFNFTNNRCVGVPASGTIFQSCLQNINMAQLDSMDGSVVSDNQARYCNYCFTFDSLTNSSVTGNTARDVFSVGYTYEASSCVNTTFTGNTAEGIMDPPGVMALINVANGCIFTGNTFKNTSVDPTAATISFNSTAPKGATNIVSNNTVIISGGTGIFATNNDSIITSNAVRGGVNCINLTGGTGRTVLGNVCVGQSGTPIINADATDVVCGNTALGCNPLKLRVAGGTPALTSCGTSPAIVGSDMAGEVTMGTGTPVGCVITFNVAYVAAPLCTVTWQATPLAAQSYAVSTAAITLTQTATSSNKVNYTCVARIGG